MELGDAIGRLDGRFRPAAFDEHDGWDMAFGPGERESLLARASAAFSATFNGLMSTTDGGGEPAIDRVYLLVFPEASLLERVIAEERERGAPGAMVFTHHVADFETSDRGFRSIPVAQLDALRAANLALHVLHAPLDCHPEIST
ncbi:MAG: hypothetical protein M3Q10_11020, partial [Chloroflexota bacterium]|nr:hypothetical protein [Chloroflexota bacterium]